MRLHIVSDLHLEFADFCPSHPEIDVAIFAGDIDVGENGLRWIRENFPQVPVVYVLGNHEFYGHALPVLYKNLIQDSLGTNVHILENAAFEFGDAVFLGATLWTDFALDGNPVLSETVAALDMADFRQIRFGHESRKFRPSDARELHARSLRWLDEAIKQYAGKRIVVVTHHAPSPRSIDKKYEGNPLNPAFASRLDDFIAEREIALWVHGHIHHCSDYLIGKTHVLANTRGYPSENTGGFKPELVVEI
jgi:hypothetical protein